MIDISEKNNLLNTKNFCQLVAKLFECTPVTFIFFARVKNDGAVQTLCSDLNSQQSYLEYTAQLFNQKRLEALSGRYTASSLIAIEAEHKNAFLIISQTSDHTNLFFIDSDEPITMRTFMLNYSELINSYLQTLQTQLVDFLEVNKVESTTIPTCASKPLQLELIEKFTPEKKFELIAKIRGENVKSLTKQETKCFLYASQGLSSKLIAQKINLSYRTVEGYLERIKVKLGCQTKGELINRFNYIE